MGFSKVYERSAGKKGKKKKLERERRIIRIRGERERIWSDNDTCGKNLGKFKVWFKDKD